jgi:hypothetical protein
VAAEQAADHQHRPPAQPTPQPVSGLSGAHHHGGQDHHRLPRPPATARTETLKGRTEITNGDRQAVTETLRRARQAGQAGRPGSQAEARGENQHPARGRGLRDRALLLLGFAGAFRRAELARIKVAHLEAAEHGLRITLPFSKGDRGSKGVLIGIPYGASALRPVRALARWRDAAGITAGPLLRRIWTTPRPKNPPPGWTLIRGCRRGTCPPRSVPPVSLEPQKNRNTLTRFSVSNLR